jgi:hypothetical protein
MTETSGPQPKGRATGISQKRGRKPKGDASAFVKTPAEIKKEKAVAKAKSKVYEKAKADKKEKASAANAEKKAKKSRKSEGGDDLWDGSEDATEKDRLRAVVFTVNNYDGTEIPALRAWDKVRYCTVGREVGKKCGTPHLQGYLQFFDKVSFQEIIRRFPRMRVRRARGTVEQNNDYTQKDGDFERWGDPTQQGQRTDWDEVADMAKRGCSHVEIGKAYPTLYMRCSRGIRDLCDVHKDFSQKSEYSLASMCKRLQVAPIMFDEKTTVLEGPPNIGKTEFALAHFENPFMCSHIDQLRHFDPALYDGIVFDDVTVAHLPRSTQINVSDWTKGREVHGRNVNGYIPAHTRKIFTCNPGNFPFYFDGSGAVERRVQHIILHVTREELDERDREQCERQQEESDESEEPEALDFDALFEFTPSPAFTGAYDGWVYKSGSFGVGYYRDSS